MFYRFSFACRHQNALPIKQIFMVDEFLSSSLTSRRHEWNSEIAILVLDQSQRQRSLNARSVLRSLQEVLRHERQSAHILARSNGVWPLPFRNADIRVYTSAITLNITLV